MVYNKELERLGIDLYIIENKGNIIYDIYPRTSKNIYDEIITDFIKVSSKYARSHKERERINTAKQIIFENDYTIETLSKFIKLSYKQFKQKGYEILQELTLGIFEPEEIESKIVEFIYDNISLQVYSHGKEIKKSERERIDKLFMLTKRFKPNYLKVKKKYTAYVSSDENEILKVMEELKTCKRNDRYAAKKWAIDIGTFFLIVKNEDDLPVGYTRIFLYKNKKNRPFLAIDTLEVPREIKDIYGNAIYADNLTEYLANLYKDIIRAEGLASILLLMDLNADYLVGDEGRVKFGLRQAMSNKKIRIEGNKIGKLMNPGEYYSYPDILNERTLRDTRNYLLFLNWKKYV